MFQYVFNGVGFMIVCYFMGSNWHVGFLVENN